MQLFRAARVRLRTDGWGRMAAIVRHTALNVDSFDNEEVFADIIGWWLSCLLLFLLLPLPEKKGIDGHRWPLKLFLPPSNISPPLILSTIALVRMVLWPCTKGLFAFHLLA